MYPTVDPYAAYRAELEAFLAERARGQFSIDPYDEHGDVARGVRRQALFGLLLSVVVIDLCVVMAAGLHGVEAGLRPAFLTCAFMAGFAALVSVLLPRFHRWDTQGRRLEWTLDATIDGLGRTPRRVGPGHATTIRTRDGRRFIAELHPDGRTVLTPQHQ